MSNNKKIGSSHTYLRLFDSTDFFFSHHPIPTTCLLWHCNFLNDERFAMQDKSKEKNLNQNSTIILNVDKISSTLHRNVLIYLNHYIHFVNPMVQRMSLWIITGADGFCPESVKIVLNDEESTSYFLSLSGHYHRYIKDDIFWDHVILALCLLSVFERITTF